MNGRFRFFFLVSMAINQENWIHWRTHDETPTNANRLRNSIRLMSTEAEHVKRYVWQSYILLSCVSDSTGCVHCVQHTASWPRHCVANRLFNVRRVVNYQIRNLKIAIYRSTNITMQYRHFWSHIHIQWTKRISNWLFDCLRIYFFSQHSSLSHEVFYLSYE